MMWPIYRHLDHLLNMCRSANGRLIVQTELVNQVPILSYLRKVLHMVVCGTSFRMCWYHFHLLNMNNRRLINETQFSATKRIN